MGDNSLENLCFSVLNLFYSLQRRPTVLLQRKLCVSKESEGSNIFGGGGGGGGVQLFTEGGPNVNFYRI